MLKKIGIGVMVVLVGLAVVIAMRPDTFAVERHTTIAASPAVVFGSINDFHKWDAWSPWAKLDPAQKTEFTGSPAGPGAVYSWAGNDKVGEGRMTILDIDPGKHIAIQLDFIKPFSATNLVDFTLTPTGSGTAVVWGMSGNNNFMGKAMSLFASMDKMVGGDFERGLTNLKAVSEAEQARQVAAAKAAADAAAAKATADEAAAKALADKAAADAAALAASGPAPKKHK